MFLYYLQRIARTLLPLRPWCLWGALAGGICAFWTLVQVNNPHATLLRISLLFTLWMLMTHAYIKLFQDIPSPVLPGLSWWERWRQKAGLWGYQLLGIGVLLVGLSLFSLSIKLWLLQ